MGTRWRPDTCACVLVYDGLEESGRPINPVVEHDCGAHGKWEDAYVHFARVVAYNRAVGKLKLRKG